MKILWKDLEAAGPAFAELRTTKGLGSVLSHQIGRNDRIFRQAIEELGNTRLKLAQEYGKADDTRPGAFTFEKDKVLEFDAEMKKLMEAEADFPFHRLSQKALDERGVDLSPQIWSLLWWLMEEPE